MATTIASSGDQPHSTYARSPFDDPDADVILRSSDNTDFRVFKSFLSYASPFFKSMFALPQVPEGDDSNETRDGVPVIQVTEERDTLQRLLLLCYPLDVPSVDTLTQVQAVLEAALKYDMKRVEKQAKEWLIEPKFVEAEPVRVLVIACRYRFQEEFTVATMFSLGRQIHEEVDEKELDHMTGRQFFRLLQYHNKCAAAVKGVATDFGWIETRRPGVPFCWFECQSCSSAQNRIQIGRTVRRAVRQSLWWLTYMRGIDAALADGTWSKVKKNLMDEAMLGASRCRGGSCEMYGAPAHMIEFIALLEAQMQRVIAEVRDIRPGVS
jgi:hypothetical protein